ncbi:MAG: 23S rRNA (adenine(2503)-C(2))-methyltransferase RlmN [Pseudomonadota bacterium]
MKILQLTYAELLSEFQQCYGKGSYHAAAVYREVFKNGGVAFSSMPEFIKSPGLALEINNALHRNLLPVIEEKKEAGLTKFITRLRDGLKIESVVVPMPHHKTICISSQAGCRMGCTFCATGRMGLLRNITVEEIVGQVYAARFTLGHKIKNIVFMGMGEPLDNFENVIQAIRVLNDQRGLDFAHRHITVSTCGLVHGMNKLAELNWPLVNLAISLNAPNNALRSAIMPINNAFPLDRLKQALREYPLKKSGVFLIEYILIENINDSRKHARELALFLEHLRVRVNVIPFNPLAGSPFAPPSEEKTQQFCSWLAGHKLFTRSRSSKGQSLMAGCGQLGSRYVQRLKHNQQMEVQL